MHLHEDRDFSSCAFKGYKKRHHPLNSSDGGLHTYRLATQYIQSIFKKAGPSKIFMQQSASPSVSLLIKAGPLLERLT